MMLLAILAELKEAEQKYYETVRCQRGTQSEADLSSRRLLVFDELQQVGANTVADGSAEEERLLMVAIDVVAMCSDHGPKLQLFLQFVDAIRGETEQQAERVRP